MGEMRKITVDVSAEALEAATAEGDGVAETVRKALEERARKRAYEKLLALRGKVKFTSTWRELRGKDDDD